MPVIQVSTEFDVFFPGTLLGKNRVVSRYKISIFTIVKITKPARRTTQKRDIHISAPSVNKFKRGGGRITKNTRFLKKEDWGF